MAVRNKLSQKPAKSGDWLILLLSKLQDGFFSMNLDDSRQFEEIDIEGMLAQIDALPD